MNTTAEPSVEEFIFIDSGREPPTIDSGVPSLPEKPIEGIKAEPSVKEFALIDSGRESTIIDSGVPSISAKPIEVIAEIFLHVDLLNSTGAIIVLNQNPIMNPSVVDINTHISTSFTSKSSFVFTQTSTFDSFLPIWLLTQEIHIKCKMKRSNLFRKSSTTFTTGEAL